MNIPCPGPLHQIASYSNSKITASPNHTFFDYLGTKIAQFVGGFNSETIEACDLKVGRYRQLIDFMMVCEY